jgi:hypothetical protein
MPGRLRIVAADVRRLHQFREISQSLLTSAATVQGLKVRNSSGNSHTTLSHPMGERAIRDLCNSCARRAGFKVSGLTFKALRSVRSASPAQVQTIYNFKTDQVKVDDEFWPAA